MIGTCKYIPSEGVSDLGQKKVRLAPNETFGETSVQISVYISSLNKSKLKSDFEKALIYSNSYQSDLSWVNGP